MLKKENGPPIPSFDSYQERIESEFAALLDRDPAETEVQAFLERNPCMVPGARTPINHSGSQPLHMALIARPSLHGFGARVPDFMWLSCRSAAWFPAMVEIERPGKRLFLRDGTPSSEFNQARNQLVQWQTWLDDPSNALAFMDHYGISTYHRRHCAMGKHFLLIYGRRSEYIDEPALSKHRAHLLTGDGEDLMSFGRLKPDPTLHYVVSAKAIGNGRFKVLHVPETFALNPLIARHFSNLVGLDEAIDRNERIPTERAACLKKRWPEWVGWYRSTLTEPPAFRPAGGEWK